MKIAIPDPTYDRTKFVFDGKKDEDVGVIVTYILGEIHFHIGGIDFPHQVWKKLKSLFNRVNEKNIMQLKKELISLNPHSFDIIEDYLVHVKEIWLKLGECGKNY
jgi:hypothetical protein